MKEPRQNIPSGSPTRYEVGLIKEGKTLHIYGYTSRRSMDGLIQQTLGQDVEHLLTPDDLLEGETFQMDYTPADGIYLTSKVKIAFTGRTERDAKNHPQQT